MPFNPALAQAIAHERPPRDEAHYFEGRQRELQAIRNALQGARSAPAAVFTVFQGPPGSGKTSLAHHAGRLLREEAPFIKLRHADLESRGALLRRIEDVALAQHGKAHVTLGHWAAAAMAKATGSALSDRAADALTDRALSGLAVIIHVDEAHSLPHKALDTLKDLHIAGIEAGSPLPCLVLLTGLQRTLTHITARPGLTRCADGATYHLMPLTEPECKASTARMLADLLTESAPVRQTDSIAAASGPWSFGHPRHLLTVQQAICSELLRVNGQASKMDARRIEADTAERRFAYYSRRVNEVTAGPRRTQAVLRTLIELAEHPTPADPEAAAALIDQAINSGQTPEIPLSECQSLVSNMAAKGLIENALERWVVAIPSMATWAEERLDSQPSAEVEP